MSSSGHLILTRQVFQFPDPGKTYDIILHLATLIALVIYFWTDLTDICSGIFKDIKNKKLYGTPDTNMAWFLIISTIPGGAFGLLFKDRLEQITSIYPISTLLIIFGLILYIADIKGRKERNLESITLKDAVIIGLFQAVALFPGVSRSGITMTAALLLGFDRQTAARYSFLISIPLIAGISAYGVFNVIRTGLDSGGMMIYGIGFLASLVSGFLCIKFLLDYLKRGSFAGFVIYRVLLGLLLVGLGIAGVIK